MINIHVYIKPKDKDHATMRIGYQRPEVTDHVPYVATNGIVIDLVGSGRPFLGMVNGKVTFGVRSVSCPEEYSHNTILTHLYEAEVQVEKVKEALKEFRRKIGRYSS